MWIDDVEKHINTMHKQVEDGLELSPIQKARLLAGRKHLEAAGRPVPPMPTAKPKPKEPQA